MDQLLDFDAKAQNPSRMKMAAALFGVAGVSALAYALFSRFVRPEMKSWKTQEEAPDPVEEASMESFPASDPPAYNS